MESYHSPLLNYLLNPMVSRDPPCGIHKGACSALPACFQNRTAHKPRIYLEHTFVQFSDPTRSLKIGIASNLERSLNMLHYGATGFALQSPLARTATRRSRFIRFPLFRSLIIVVHFPAFPDFYFSQFAFVLISPFFCGALECS